MTLSLIIGEKIGIATIADFFDRAGPDARIRARTSNNGATELYVRDMSVGGRLIEWLFTSEKERKNSFVSAKSIIANSARNGAGTNRKNSEPLQNILESISAHQHDFLTKEIGKSLDRLSDDIRQPRAREAVELGFESLAPDERRYLYKLANVLNSRETAKLADEICRLLQKPGHREVIQEGFESLCAYLQAKQEGHPIDAIDFVSIQQFETAFAGAMNILTLRTMQGTADCPTMAKLPAVNLLFSACITAGELSAPSNYIFTGPDTPADAFVAGSGAEAPEDKDPVVKAQFDTMKNSGQKLSSFNLAGSLFSRPQRAFCMEPRGEFFSIRELESHYRDIALDLEGVLGEHESYSLRLPVFAPYAEKNLPFEASTQRGAAIFADAFSGVMSRMPQAQFQIVLPPAMTQQDFINALEASAQRRREQRNAPLKPQT